MLWGSGSGRWASKGQRRRWIWKRKRRFVCPSTIWRNRILSLRAMQIKSSRRSKYYHSLGDIATSSWLPCQLTVLWTSLAGAYLYPGSCVCWRMTLLMRPYCICINAGICLAINPGRHAYPLHNVPLLKSPASFLLHYSTLQLNSASRSDSLYWKAKHMRRLKVLN